MRRRATLLARAQSPQAVVVGLMVFLACGVLVALLGARLLRPRDYTVFAAFSGLFGVLVLGPASSLEQEGALRAGAGRPDRRPMVVRAAVVWALVALLVLLPVGGWQRRLLADETPRALVALVLGAPVVLLLGVLRGLAAGRGAYRLVAAAHTVAGAGTLVLPLALRAAGVRPLTAFVVGAAAAWLPALLLLLVRSQPPAEGSGERAGARGATAWLVLANLLLLANLLAVPPLLRWHVADVGAGPVADAQLLVSLSRLATTMVLGFLPLVLGRLGVEEDARGPVLPRPALPRPALLLAAAIGGLAVAGTALLGGVAVELLTGRTSELGVSTALLAGLPVALLCPGVVLMAVAVARGRYVLVCAAWGAGLVVLAATAAVDAHGHLAVVLAGILLAAVLPLVALLGGSLRTTR